MKGIGLVIIVAITSGVSLAAGGTGGKLFPTLEDSPIIAKKNKKKKKPLISPTDVRTEKNQYQQPKPNRKGGVKWISVAVLFKFLLAFKSFGAPFFDPLGEPRRATESSIYFSFIAVLYVWLASVTTLTIIPHVSTQYNVITAAALFFYMGFTSLCSLLAGRFIIRCAYYIWLLWKRGMIRAAFISSSTTTLDSTKMLPVLVHWHRPFRRVCKSSWVISAVLCSFYTHCWSRSLTAFKVSRADGASFVCQGIFTPLVWLGFTSNNYDREHTCADEFSIWVLWALSIIGHLFYYFINEFNGYHHKGYIPSRKRSKSLLDNILGLEISKSSSSMDSNSIQPSYSDDGFDNEEDDEQDERDAWPSISATIQKFKRIERPQGTLPMVSWYSQIVFSTGFDLLLSAHVFLGRFDARKMQSALIGKESKCSHQSNPPNLEGLFDFSDCDSDSEFWFDFMSDCGDGFNSSYQVARMLAQPNLHVYTSSQSKRSRMVNTLPRGKLLVIGGDLAYPDPTPESEYIII